MDRCLQGSYSLGVIHIVQSQLTPQGVFRLRLSCHKAKIRRPRADREPTITQNSVQSQSRPFPSDSFGAMGIGVGVAVNVGLGAGVSPAGIVGWGVNVGI